MFLDDFESAYSANNLDDQEGKEQEGKAIEEEENAAALAANGSNEVPLQIPDSGVLGEISPSLPNVPDVPFRLHVSNVSLMFKCPSFLSFTDVKCSSSFAVQFPYMFAKFT